MHDYGHYCSLSWSLPVFLLAFTCTEYELYSCIQPPKTKVANCVHHIYLYVVFHCHSKVNFLCATFKTFKSYYLFCAPVLAHEEALDALLSLPYLCWLHTLTSMHNVLVLNFSKEQARVPTH